MEVKYSVLWILLMLITACNNKETRYDPNTKVITLERNVGDQKAGKDLYSKIEFIPLKEDDDYLIGEVTKAISNDSIFYILDANKSQALYSYSYTGTPTGKFYHFGGGRNEYAEIIDFTVDSVNQEISIFCLPPKLIITDLNFNIKKDAVILGSEYADRMEKLNDTYYFYNHYTRRVTGYDIEQNKFTNLLEVKNMKGSIFTSRPTFYPVSGKLYFQAPGDDCIYVLEGSRFIPYLIFDYENKASSRKFYSNARPDNISFEERRINLLPYVSCVFEKAGNISFFYTFDFGVRSCLQTPNGYSDQSRMFFVGGGAVAYKNNCLFTCAFTNEEPLFNPAPEYAEYVDLYKAFMEGVSISYPPKDENFENPIMVIYHLN